MPMQTAHIEIVVDEFVDDITKAIDYDIWKEQYNYDTAEEPEFVEENRERLRSLLYDFHYALSLLYSNSSAGGPMTLKE